MVTPRSCRACYHVSMMDRLSPLETQVLARWSTAVRQFLGARLQRLELFGSRARGQGHLESDLDLLVLAQGLTRVERGALLDIAADLGVEYGLALSPLIMDSAKWREDLPLAAEVRRDGIPL